MIACKARFAIPLLAFVTGFLPVFAQGYISRPLYEIDKQGIDYTQRHLSDTVRMLLYQATFSVKQSGYANNSGNLTNLQIGTNFAQLLGGGNLGLAPDNIDRDLYNAERVAVRLYESFARRWDRLNPIPGLYYDIVIRSAAYPFVFMESIDRIAFDFGTFPFTDDLKFRQTDLGQRQFAFGFRIIF